MYIVIEHCCGEIFDEPFIIFNEVELIPYLNGDYLIYFLDYYEKDGKKYLHRYKKENN